jgi:hypothetical protein
MARKKKDEPQGLQPVEGFNVDDRVRISLEDGSEAFGYFKGSNGASLIVEHDVDFSDEDGNRLFGYRADQLTVIDEGEDVDPPEDKPTPTEDDFPPVSPGNLDKLDDETVEELRQLAEDDTTETKVWDGTGEKPAWVALWYNPGSRNWSKFSTEAKARAFVMEANRESLFFGPTEMAMYFKQDEMVDIYQKLVRAKPPKVVNKTELANRLWPLLVQIANAPYDTTDEQRRVAKADRKAATGAKPATTPRAARKYYLSYDPQNPDHVKSYDGLPPQAKVCVQVLLEGGVGKDGVSQEYVEQLFGKPSVAERLKTKQDAMRVFSYYRSKVISLGLMQFK